MPEPKYTYRLPPCPAYDVAGTEQWLGEMAAQGYRLTRDGFFLGFGSFEVAAPQTMRYRLEAAPRAAGVLDEPDAPDDEAQALSKDLGWQYITRRGDFYVYATADPDAPELNTDPAVQALALAAVTKRARTATVDLIVELLLWVVLFPFLRADGRFLISILNLGTPLTLLGTAILTAAVIFSAKRAITLRRLQKHLAAGGTIDRAKPRSAARHHLVRVGFALVILVYVAILMTQCAHALDGSNETAIANAPDDIPFATLEDLVDTPVDYKQTISGIANTYRTWSDPLAPVNYNWDEVAQVTAADGTMLEGGLYIDYHEAANAAIAHVLAREYHRAGKWAARDDYKVLPLDLPGLDYAVAFLDQIHIPTVVLQKGNIVICAALHQHTNGAEGIPLETWAAKMAECLN